MTRGGFYEYYAQGYLPSQVHGNPYDPDIKKTREYRLAGKEASLWKAGGREGLYDDPVGGNPGSTADFGKQADASLFGEFMKFANMGSNPNVMMANMNPAGGLFNPGLVQ
jgi:hypothetical protein